MKRNSFITVMGIAVNAALSAAFINIAPEVIYGKDDRLDVYQVNKEEIRTAADSTVAIIPIKSLVAGNDVFKIVSKTFAEDKGLCADEPFRDQPVAAVCSGALVGPDLIATAGHCIATKEDCANYAVAFGYAMKDASTYPETIPANQIYNCKEIVAREYSSAQDYAVIRLDRPVVDHKVLTLQKAPAEPRDSVYVIGYPSGLPEKIADGARVRTQKGSYFRANLDTYGGNSGSPVFNSKTNEVVGILVRGEQDFVYDPVKQCVKSNICDNAGCRGEDSTNISYVIDAIDRSH
ncbi:MAG: trypsin-like serine peptidase [Pseudobdellovibrionaceae bacterium]